MARRAASAKLRQGYKGQVAHARQEERGEEATLGGLSRCAEGALDNHRSAVGDVGKVGENGGATTE